MGSPIYPELRSAGFNREMNRKQQYLDYIKSEHWRLLRRAKLASFGRICAVCSTTKTTIHVHHIRYKSFIDCAEADLAVLCKDCHDDFHLASRVFKFDYIEVEIPHIAKAVTEARTDPDFIRVREGGKIRRANRKERRKQRRQKAQPKQPVQVAEKVANQNGHKFKDRRREVRTEFKRASHSRYSNAALKKLAEFLLKLSEGPDVVSDDVESFRYSPAVITPELIESLKTSQKGWTREVLKSVGVPWPPPSGWRKALLKQYEARQ